MYDTDVGRRTVLATAGAAVAGSLAGCTGDGSDGGDSGGSDGSDAVSGSTTVAVGPDGEFVFDPDSLTIEAGTTVTFVWESANHNLVVESGPDDGWSGYEAIEGEGYEHEHTFEVTGTYEYICEPHVSQGMEATIEVVEA